MNAQKLSARQLALLHNQLSERDLAIVRQVSELRYMSARQIEAVHFGPGSHASQVTATRTCRRVLERLTTHRLLLRLERRIGGVRAGSSSFIYCLGPIGQRILNLDGARKRFREPTGLFVDHTLAIGQLVVELTLAAEAGRFDLLVVEAEPQCWRSFSSFDGLQVLKPDLFVVLGVGEYELRWFVEIDRGQESVPVLVRKCRHYDAYYRSGTEQKRHGVFPRACWVVPDDQRAERLIKAIGSARDLTEELFAVTVSERAVATLAGAEQ